MNKFSLVVSILALIATNTFAQIPNSGFETWEDYIDNGEGCSAPYNTYQKPDFWVGSLPYNCQTNSFSIQKNNESYPSGTGQYSMKIQPNIANGVRGVAISSDGPDPMKNWIPKPSFAINSRPASLYLYYKCFPSGGDTIIGMVYFYKNGVVIGNPTFGNTQTVANWTALEIPMTYTNSEVPDSATILFVTGAYVQHTESTLYLDNLSFNGFATSIANNRSAHTTFSVSPNPASDIITIQIANRNQSDLTMNVYTTIGTLVKSKILTDNQNQIDIEDLSNGIYVLELKSFDLTSMQRLIIQR